MWDCNEMYISREEFYALTNDEKIKKSNGILSDKNFAWPMFSAAMVAYAAKRYNDNKLKEKAWELIFSEIDKESNMLINNKEIITWKKINEDKHVTTNCISQWCINTIVCLELIDC